MKVERAGCFPNPRRPRILWVGVGDGTQELCALHDALAQFIEDVRNDCGVESALDAIEKFNVRFGCGLAGTSRARTHGGCMVHGTLLLVMMDFSFA